MSELMNPSDDRTGLRTKLLATVSGAALLVTLCASQPSMASDADKPMVWIELGGEFTRLESSQEVYLPPFVLGTSREAFITQSPASIQKSASVSRDANAELTFQPKGMDWALSLGIIYGRSGHRGSQHQQTPQRSKYGYGPGYDAYQGATAKTSESHTILDFEAGRDVGLGILGSNGQSRINLGVRYAQLKSRASANVQYQPTNTIKYYHRFFGSMNVERNFTGVGPSLSWTASAELIGNADSGISLDWGVNGAALFGRQKIRGHHQTSRTSYPQKTVLYQHAYPLNRNKQVIVPNLGGFAGVSWRYEDAKISFGYRADMFFGAIDGGIAAAKKENRGFYGPFASISIGIGD